MRIKAKFATFGTNRRIVAGSGLIAALGILGSNLPVRAQESAQHPQLSFEIPAVSFDRPAPPVSAAPPSPTKVTLEGISLFRSAPKTTALTGPNGATVYTPVTSDDLDIGKWSQGIKATVDADVFDRPFQFSAFWVAPYASDILKTGLSTGTSGSSIRTNAIYANDPGGDISNYTNSQNIAQLFVSHSSQLLGAEANDKALFGVPGLLLGVRALYFGEDLGTVTQKISPTTGIDAVTVQTRNYMFGPQIGFDGMIDIGGGVKVGGAAKIGLFANFVERERSFISRNQTQTRAQQNFTSDTAMAEGAELNPRLEIPIAKGITFTAGGTFLWLNNISTPFSQYATVTDLQDRNVRAKDSAFFYGFQAGLSFNLDTLASAAPTPPAKRFLEGKVLELNGPSPISITPYGEINQMAMYWNDGVEHKTRVVDNTTAPSIMGVRTAIELSRGWTMGSNVEGGMYYHRSTSVSQDLPGGETEFSPELRYLDAWIRNNQLGKVTAGHTSTATDGIILIDTSETNGAASANIGTIGDDLMLRAADSLDLGSGSLITRTSIGDFFGGATLDTLRRDLVRYETPEWKGFEFSVSANDKFWDTAIRYKLDLANWKIRAGIGYLRDTDPGSRESVGGTRDRRELKGAASVLHTPTGLFLTAAFVDRKFGGNDPSDQSTFGENTVDPSGTVIPGTTRPNLKYGYLKGGLRKSFTDLGDTKFFAEGAIAKDGITGLREAGPKEVTSSQLNMLGAGVMQDVDAYSMQIYAGYRHFSFNVLGVRDSTTFGAIASPAPIKDIDLVYSGVRVVF